MNTVHNRALQKLSQAWRLDGDLMVCCECGRGLIASRDGEKLSHRVDCENRERTDPWQELRLILSSQPMSAIQ